MEETFVDKEDGTVCSMEDEHELIKISDREVEIGNIGKIVHGDTNSQMLCFEIDRYYDHVDLLNMNFCVMYQNAGGIYKDEATNISYSDKHIRFNWVMPYAATQYIGTLLVSTCAYGINDGKDYCLKSKSFSLKIESSIEDEGVSEVEPDNWFVNTENRLTEIEKNRTSRVFVGTIEQVQTAIDKGELTDDMLVYMPSLGFAYIEDGKIVKIPTSDNNLTDELKNQYDNAVTNVHTHSNLQILEGITKSDEERGQLLFEGNILVDNIYLYNEVETLKKREDDKFATKIQLDEAKNSLNTELTGKIETETTRAQNAENDLSDRISDEVDRAKIAENNIQSKLDSEISRANSEENTIATNLLNEVTRAKAAEKTLTDNLSQEITDRANADTAINNSLNSEISRAKSAEAANADAISSETTRSTAKEGEIATNLSNEVTRAKGAESTLTANLSNHTSNKSNPHDVTASQIGLGNVDNTSDINKPVSTAQQTAIDTAYSNSNAYTDQKIADLIGGSSETMGTLKEIADAIEENKDVITTLDEAIGKKANQTELDTHTGNDTIHITASERTNWNDANDKKHTHSNKDILDNISDTLITAWNNAVTHISDTVKHVTSSERTLWNTVSNKVDKVEGKGLSTNDYTDEDKAKLDSLSSGGSSGSVISADKLTTSAGSVTQPIYFKDGKPVACDYTLNKSVPSDAVFTDTTYSDATTSSSGLMSSTDKTKLNSLNDTLLKKLGESSEGTLTFNGSEIKANGTADYVTNTKEEAQKAIDDGLVEDGASIYVKEDSDDPTAVMIGATSDADGVSGYVPTPKAGQENMFLRGDGTWSSVEQITVDSALSDTSTNPVQNKVIKSALDGKADNNHTHSYLPLSGGTLTGQLKINGMAGSSPLMVRGIVGSDGNGTVSELHLQYGANSIIKLGNDAKYSISADGSNYSGNSATATALTTSAGSATQPIYFSGGKPVACTYTLGKSVPSDAKFTDTTYSVATTSANGLMSSSDKKKLDSLGNSTKAFKAQSTAPEDTSILWIDTSSSTPLLKYYNGTTWTGVGAVWG